MAFTIRKAKIEDTPEIFKLIQALAEYEKLSHEVLTNEEQLKAQLFSDAPNAYVYLALEEERVVGFSLYFLSFSTFLGRNGIYLEDLFVYPEYRGKGYGKALLKNLASLCLKEGYGRLEWSVLDWNQPAIKFYESVGAKPQSEWTVYRMTEKKMEEFVDKIN